MYFHNSAAILLLTASLIHDLNETRISINTVFYDVQKRLIHQCSFHVCMIKTNKFDFRSYCLVGSQESDKPVHLCILARGLLPGYIKYGS